jgi:dethiobiotin synthetase
MLEQARWWQERSDILIVEGAGGLMSPLEDDHFNADLAVDLDAGLIIVADNKLGVINHTLQTLVAAMRFNLDSLGVVLNHTLPNHDLSTETNERVLRYHIGRGIFANADKLWLTRVEYQAEE